MDHHGSSWIIMDHHGLIMSYHPFSPVNYDSALAAHGAAGLQGSVPGAWRGSHSAVGGDDAGLKATQQGCLKDADAWTGH